MLGTWGPGAQVGSSAFLPTWRPGVLSPRGKEKHRVAVARLCDTRGGRVGLSFNPVSQGRERLCWGPDSLDALRRSPRGGSR